MKNRAFTFVELMIVVAIIGILAAVGLPQYGKTLERANLGATLGNLAAIRSAITIYYADNAVYPENLDTGNPSWVKYMGVRIPPVQAMHPPANPPRGSGVTVGTYLPAEAGSGWYYNRNDGWIYINSTATDIKGNPYTIY